MAESKPRKIKMYCPSLKKLVQFVAWDDHKLDLGSIARTFGLDPSTLKLNRHFIARGLDLVACSVTWRSLLCFFSSKGLSTGRHDADALLVDGKLFKVGGKRTHDHHDDASGINCRIEHDNFGVSRVPHEEMNLLNNKKLKGSSGCDDDDFQRTEGKGFGFKRKQWFEVVSPLKKLKIDESKSDIQGREKDFKSTIPSSKFTCSYLSENIKRMREDEAIVAAPCKKIK